MESLWQNSEIKYPANGDDLDMRVYTSRLLGMNANLVLHGGGNTSVKSKINDFFGDEHDVLLVKGSGWDLKTIERLGFAPVKLDVARRLATLDTLSDQDMVEQLRLALLDQSAPTPSVEAILHAILPYKYVDHTHTDAVVTISNTPKGNYRLNRIFPDVLILPYIMPGFILSKQVYDAIQKVNLSDYKGIILEHHGLFTFDDDAQVSYENMIELVTRAEDYLTENATNVLATGEASASPLALAEIRKAVSELRGYPVLAKYDNSATAVGFASLDNVADLATRGPMTPDHVLRNKRIAAIIGDDYNADIARFEEDYKNYFAANKKDGLNILDCAPRWAVWKDKGLLAFSSTEKEMKITSDIYKHTITAIQKAHSLGGWTALSQKDVFDVEYWELEQAKLKKAALPKVHQGKVAVITGAAHGIGLATSKKLNDDGAVVIGLDIDASIVTNFNQPGMYGIKCNICDKERVKGIVEKIVLDFGGIDIFVGNAGIFTAGDMIENLEDSVWDKTLAINLTAHQRLLKFTIPYLKKGIAPSVIFIGSRNVNAPGSGASAYSVSKAAITQLTRVAALELAKFGVRVNVIHPDAVFDTELWTEALLKSSAERYGITVEEYKTKNLLKTEIKSIDVAAMVSAVSTITIFGKTTGAEIPIDGGNNRVI